MWSLWKSEFIYDGKMRRRVRKEYSWVSSAWVQSSETRYIYDGNLVIQERDNNNIPTVSCTRGRDLSGSLEGAGGIGGLLARTDNGQLTANSLSAHAYYHADGNGNITSLINTQQVVVARYLYDPFGNTLSASGPLSQANLYRFSSKELHANSGLVYYLYRFYEPNLQRWPNRDPLGEPGFQAVRDSEFDWQSDDINLYSFVGNAPANLIDPKVGEAPTIRKHLSPATSIGIAKWNGLNRPSSSRGMKLSYSSSKGLGCFQLTALLLSIKMAEM